MKKEDLFDAVTDINDGFIEEAEHSKRLRTAKIVRFVGNAAAIIVIAVVLLNNGGFEKKKAMDTTSNIARSEAITEDSMLEESKLVEFGQNSSGASGALLYDNDPNLVLASSVPVMAQAPTRDDSIWNDDKAYSDYESASTDHYNDIEKQRSIIPAIDDESDGFTAKLITELFKDVKNDNLTVSPMNVYLALAILTETTDNNTRDQLLNALGAKNIEGLRNNCDALWNYNYIDDGISTSLLGSSLWLNNRVGFKTETLARIANIHRASTFSGEMGSASLNKSLQNWMNTMTGNLLEDQISSMEFTPDTVASIVTTIYFKDSWTEKFNPEANTEEVFKGAKGDKTVTFMNKAENGSIYRGKNFTSSSLSMNNGYSMQFLLPNDGKSPADLFNDEEALSYILSSDNAPESRSSGLVFYAIPKFDTSSQVELSETLKALGVTDVFNEEKSDFSPLTDDIDVFVSSVLHGARVKIDEEGCEAAAYTAIMMKATGFVSETYEFTLDRPFVFVIRNAMGAPLFVGVINEID